MRNLVAMLLGLVLLLPAPPLRASGTLTPADMEAMMRTMVAMIRMWNTLQGGGSSDLSWGGWPDVAWGGGGFPYASSLPWSRGMPGGMTPWAMPPGGWPGGPWGGGAPRGTGVPPGTPYASPVSPARLRGLWRGEDGTWLYFERDLFALRTPAGNETLGRFALAPGVLVLRGVTGSNRRLALRLTDGYMELGGEGGQSQRFLRVWPRASGVPGGDAPGWRW